MKRKRLKCSRGLDAEFQRWREGGIISSELLAALQELHQQFDGNDRDH